MSVLLSPQVTATNNQSPRFKLQVLIMAYGFNIFLYLMLIALFIFSPGDFYILPVLLVVVGSLGRVFANKRKYVYNLTIDSDELHFQYYTGLLKMKTESFALDGFEDAEILRRVWLVGYIAAVNIKAQGQRMTYHVIDKRTLQYINLKLRMIKGQLYKLPE